MGAGATALKADMTEVGIKNDIGALYDGESKQAFDAAATEGPDGTRSAPWIAIEAYAKKRDERWRDPRYVLFQNLKAFKAAREQLDEIARVHIKGAVKEIPWVGKTLGDDCRQCGLDGEPAASLDALYEVAALARVRYEEIITKAAGGVTLLFAPLKGRDRAKAKAEEQFRSLTPPCYSWLFDIIRGSALCNTEAEIVSLYKALEADPSVEIVRVKNRFDPPLFNGYRDINMVVAVKVGENVSHLCELQIHLAAIKNSDALHKSHTIYEFFRSFFLENGDAVEKRLDMLCKFHVIDEANDVEELVDLELGGFYFNSDLDASRLEALCELLTSISEFSGVVKVREAILAEYEREFGAESKEAGAALFSLGYAYSDLGEDAKNLEVLERALPIYEREYGSDHAEVAEVLNNLANAYDSLRGQTKTRDSLERALPIMTREYGEDSAEVAVVVGNLGAAYYRLGDIGKSRNVWERALEIEERAYGLDHTEVAATLDNLGNAYGDLDDHAKAREMLKRALVIKERAYGRDHTELATTLTNLGCAYGGLGDYAKQRDMVERALTILERAYGHDHADVAATLNSLGNAYGDLGDHAKKRDMVERALAIFERAYGSHNTNVAIALILLGEAHINLGDAREACKFLQRALAIHEENVGPDHMYVAYQLRGLGNAHRDLGDAPKSLELLERSLAIFERHFGPENIEVAKTRRGLGKAHVALGDVVAARSHLERAVEIFEAKWGADHRDTCRCRETLASLS